MQLSYEPIQMLWVGESVSQLEHLCMQSFLSNGHPIHLYTYGQINNVPNDVTCLNAGDILNKERIFLHKGSYACFADLFRWKLLFEKGGYYCDTDILCLKPFDFREESIIGLESHKKFNIAVLKFPKHHFLCEEMLDCAENPLKLKPYDNRKIRRKKILKKLSPTTKAIGWGETAGPPAVSRVIEHFNLVNQIAIKNFTYFYPISAGNWDALFDNTLTNEALFKNTHAVHLWNEMIRRSDTDKNAPLSRNSFIGKYFEKYCTKLSQNV